MRLISWNVAGRVSRAAAQVGALGERFPDIVALQEVREAAEPLLREGLAHAGLVHALSSRDLFRDTIWSGPRQYGVLIASRWGLTTVPSMAFEVPWPERVLSALIATPSDPVEVHTTGIPPGAANGWTKVEMFEGLYAGLAHAVPTPRILCGDLNSPQAEMRDGEIVTWGQSIDRAGRARLWRGFTDKAGRTDTGTRWDRAERSILAGLQAFDLHDVFRALHGYEREASSWYWRSGARVIGRRFDHILASKRLRPKRCEYLDGLRVNGLSDHAPIEADFEPSAPELP